MDWRVVLAGFVVSVGFAVGWLDTGAVGGTVSAAGFFAALFALGWLIDKHVYGL